MQVRLLCDVKYPAPWCRGPRYRKGMIVPTAPANNIPGIGRLWVDTPELKDDCYGILLDPEDYEVVDENCN